MKHYWLIYIITFIFAPLYITYFTAWYILAGRKGHGDIILYHDGVENF